MPTKIHHALRQLPLITAFAFGLVLAHPMQAMAAPHKDQDQAFDKSDSGHEPQAIMGQHVEGHIAFMHAELAITPEQENLWAAVADAMRQDVAEQQNAETQVAHEWHGPETAVQYLHNRTMFANLRAEGEARFLSAFQPLYENLSSTQKAAADSLLIPDPRSGN